MFTLKIKTDSAAFGAGSLRAGDLRAEVARILRDIAGRVESFNDSGSAFDANGNTVGEYKLTGSR